MSYTIFGQGPSGKISLRLDSEKTAAHRLQQLAQEGCHDLRIVDVNGHQYGPADFERVFVTRRSAQANIRASEQSRE